MSILCYHAVEGGWASPLAITPAAFEEHCEWLARHRTVIDAEAAAGAMQTGVLPRGVAAITFDDGFASVREHALGSLLRHGLTATIFVVANTLAPDGLEVGWVDTPAPYPMRTLDLHQVRELVDAGMAIGSHSLVHHDLTSLSAAECEADLRASREMLEGLLGRPVRTLAYPRGRHNETVRRCADRAGYDCGFALPTSPEQPGPFAVPRVGVFPGNTVRALRVKTNRRYVRARTSRSFLTLRRWQGRPDPAPAG